MASMSASQNLRLSSAPRASLLQQLCTEAPSLRPNPPKNGSRTNTKHKSWLTPTRIDRWDDFNYQSLINTCKGRFQSVLQLQVQPLDFSQHFEDVTEFTAEHSLECFFSKWTRTIVSFALSAAQNQFHLFEKPFIRMIQGCDALILENNDDTALTKNIKEKRLLPDWAGVYGYITEKGERRTNILPGDTKVSYKWKSREIETGVIYKNDTIPEWLWPIMQVFTYCIRGNSRYGYIITDEEVVVMRVRGPANTQESFDSGSAVEEDLGAVEYACIDYKSTQARESQGHLTVNMALWWLHLLAAKDRTIQPAYRPLDEEYRASQSHKRDSLFRSETEDEDSVVETEPPDVPLYSFQASQGAGSSFGPFSETESTLEQSRSTRKRHSSNQVQDEFREPYSNGERKKRRKKKKSK
jgi:hypothetical protein